MKKNDYQINLVLLLGEIGILLLMITLGYIDFRVYNQSALALLLIGTFIATMLFFLKREDANKKRNAFKPSVLFLIGYYIVFYQFPIDFLISEQYRFYFIDYFIDSENVYKAPWFASISLLSIYIGYLINTIRRNKNENTKNIILSNNRRCIINEKILLWLEFFLLISFITSIDFNYFRGGYGDYMNNIGIPVRFFLSQQYFMYIVVVHIIEKGFTKEISNKSVINYIRSFPYIFYCIISIWGILVLMSGDRGPVLQIGLVFCSVCVFSYLGGLSKYKLLCLIGLSALFVSFLGVFRSTSSDSSISERFAEMIDGTNSGSFYYSFSPYTAELARSIRTFCTALYFNSIGFCTYALISLYQFITIFPGMGVIAEQLLGLHVPQYTDNATSFFETDHSLGVSFLDCFIYDFGLYFTPFVLLLWGKILYMADSLAIKWNILSTFQKCFLMAFMWKSIYFARSDYFMLFRDTVAIFIIYQILVYFFSKKNYDIHK